MTTVEESARPVRTYGGWRRSRGLGLFGLGPAQTMLVLGALLTVVFAGAVSVTAMAVAAVPGAGVVGAVVLRWNGVPLLGHVLRWGRWTWAHARGRIAYRSGVLAAGPHAWELPGVLAATELLHVDDPRGAFGLVRHRRTGLLSVTWRVAATSTWLVDPEQAQAWVAGWGGWLAGLGYLPTLRWIAVTVETVPASGSTLPDAVAARIAPTAPAVAARILQRLAAAAPRVAANVNTRVTITVDPAASPAKPHTVAEGVDELARALPALEDALSGCGVTVLGRATAAQLAAVVRRAYDPGVGDDLDRLDRLDQTPLAAPDRAAERGELLDWATAGPVAADEHHGHYEHDGATSVSWAWHEAPRQQVYADVLARLLAPGPYRKRVTLLYRPLPAADAARAVDREVNAAAFRDALRAAQRRDEHARDRADRERALRAAREEATGAGVGLLSLHATTTVTHPDDLDRAVADLEGRAEIARIRLRRAWGGQAAGFAATLPCGICPPQLAAQWPR